MPAPADTSRPGGPGDSPIRLAVVGLSIGTTCGVHAHASLLAGALESEGVECSTHWLWREARSLGGARAEISRWRHSLESTLLADPPDAILLHYSVFSYSHRGVPVFVPGVLATLRRAGAPVIALLHEIVYPWGHGGARGKVWAVTQRLALIDVMRATSVNIVTAEHRVGWLSSRPWLRGAPAACVPVFSNLPRPSQRRAPAGAAPSVGLFGYAYEGAAAALVLDALALVRGRGVEAELRLLGAPGPASAVGESWIAQARSRGLEEAISFSGRLDVQDLSNAIADCDVLLFADGAGPTSRKGTLAGSLASGRPVVAIDGPHTWPALLAQAAARVVAPRPRELADALCELLDDAAEQEALGARGLAFYEREMDLSRSTAVVGELLAGLAHSAGA